MHWFNCILQRLHGSKHEQDESHAQLSVPHCGAGQSPAAGIHDQVGHIYIYHISKSMYGINPPPPKHHNTFLSTSESTLPHCTLSLCTRMSNIFQCICHYSSPPLQRTLLVPGKSALQLYTTTFVMILLLVK